MGDILVFVEHKDESVRKVSYEVLSAGKELKNFYSSRLYAAVIGCGVERISSELKKHADFILTVDEEELRDFVSENYAYVLSQLVQKYKISVVLGSHTGYGKPVLCTLAALLDWAILADLTGFEILGEKILFKKPFFGGRIVSHLSISGDTNAVLTFRPKSLKTGEGDFSGEIVRERIEIKKDERIRLLKSERKEGKKVDIQEADFIICGGRGMKSPENFRILEEIAEIMGGRVGASRSVVDAKWRDYDEQIGKSGKTVSPTIYIGCGVSGAIHHTMGIDTSKTIVAINIDPNAPIFSIADYGIVDDLFTILPLLKEELKKAKEQT